MTHTEVTEGAWSPPFAPLTMPTRAEEAGMVNVPTVGWHLACAACGYNLTEHHGEYASWHGSTADDLLADEACEWSRSACPGCKASLGNEVTDDE